MAELTVTVCDLCSSDPKAPGSSLDFPLGSVMTYRVDVCEEHRDSVNNVLHMVEEIVAVARPLVPEPTTRKARGPKNRTQPTTKAERAARKAELDNVRAWAEAMGLEVNPKGRIPAAIMDAWANAEGAPEAVADSRIGSTALTSTEHHVDDLLDAAENDDVEF